MAVDRLIPGSGATPPVTGPVFMDATAEEILALWDIAFLRLSVDTGASSANLIVATMSPAPTGSLADGMRVSFDAPYTNTSTSVVLRVNGVDKTVYDYGGVAPLIGQIAAGRTYAAEYSAASAGWRILAPLVTGAIFDSQTYTSSGTWPKPAGISPTALVLIEGWGAGGGGGPDTRDGGGGGGGYARRIMLASELGSTVAVTIGAGGTVGVAGGNTTFGSHLTAYGGGANPSGGSAIGEGGGGGGGALSAGSNGSAASGGAGGRPDGGDAGVAGTSAGGSSAMGGGGGGGGSNFSGGTGYAGGDSYEGGGGGGGGPDGKGGDSVFGGGGGGGSGSGVGGASKYGGNGGNAGVAGSAPAGGGGRNAAGARGELRVRVVG